MTKIRVNDKEYDLDGLADRAKKIITHLKSTEKDIDEKRKMEEVLVRAKRALIEDLKLEMLSSKGGFDFSQE